MSIVDQRLYPGGAESLGSHFCGRLRCDTVEINLGATSPNSTTYFDIPVPGITMEDTIVAVAPDSLLQVGIAIGESYVSAPGTVRMPVVTPGTTAPNLGNRHYYIVSMRVRPPGT